MHVNNRTELRIGEPDSARPGDLHRCPQICLDRLVPGGLSIFSVTQFSFDTAVLITLLHAMILHSSPHFSC